MTVYISQEVRGRDITDAVAFGDLEILVPAMEQVSFSTQPTVRRVARGLRNFNDEDYILLSGDPAIIGIACAEAARVNNGRFKVLKWDRLESKYFPLQVDLYHRKESS